MLLFHCSETTTKTVRRTTLSTFAFSSLPQAEGRTVSMVALYPVPTASPTDSAWVRGLRMMRSYQPSMIHSIITCLYTAASR